MTEAGGRARWTVVVLAALAAGCQRDGDAGAHGPAAPGDDGHRLHSPTGPTAMMINLDQIRTWSEQLCTLPPVDVAGALGALGLTGSLVAKSSDYAIVEPPPPGASRLGLVRAHLGKNKGNLGEVEITLGDAKITHAEIDARFGAGDVGPRVDFDRPFVVDYRVEVPGAPFRCKVLASFADEPAAASAATQIRLIREVVRAPAPGQSPGQTPTQAPK